MKDAVNDVKRRRHRTLVLQTVVVVGVGGDMTCSLMNRRRCVTSVEHGDVLLI